MIARKLKEIIKDVDDNAEVFFSCDYSEWLNQPLKLNEVEEDEISYKEFRSCELKRPVKAIVIDVSGFGF